MSFWINRLNKRKSREYYDATSIDRWLNPTSNDDVPKTYVNVDWNPSRYIPLPINPDSTASLQIDVDAPETVIIPAITAATDVELPVTDQVNSRTVGILSQILRDATTVMEEQQVSTMTDPTEAPVSPINVPPVTEFTGDRRIAMMLLVNEREISS